MKNDWREIIWMNFLFVVGISLGCLLHERFDKIEGRIEAVEERIQFYDLQLTRNESTSSMTLENGAYIYSSTEPLTMRLTLMKIKR